MWSKLRVAVQPVLSKDGLLAIWMCVKKSSIPDINNVLSIVFPVRYHASWWRGCLLCTAVSRGKSRKCSLASIADWEDEDRVQDAGDALERPADDDNVSTVRT